MTSETTSSEWLIYNLETLQQHENTIAKVAIQVQKCYDSKIPFRIFHGHTNSTRQNVLLRNESIDISSLNHILKFDLKTKRVITEPNVPMDSLVQATLQHGLIPPVVPEFPGITVGGAYAGTAGESSSFKYGFFDRSVMSVEIVLPDGTITTASPDQEGALFSKLSSTMGTLGVTTSIEIQLIDAKRYVQTTYHPVSSMPEAVSMIQREMHRESEIDFLDGIMFSPTLGAVIIGRLSNTPSTQNTPIQRFSRPWDPWFYVHAQEVVMNHPANSESSSLPTEFIPLAEYLFRYDRGGFWVGRSAFKYFFFPFNRFTRWFLDDFLHTRMLYRALQASKNVMSYVVQDCALPFSTASQFVEYTDRELGIYPLWLCPLKECADTSTFHPHCTDSTSKRGGREMKPMLNIGLWGFGPRKYQDYITTNRALERKLHDLGGMKWLYSQTYYTESEFWETYQRGWYDELRQKYRAGYLPNVWQKVRVNVEKEGKEMATSWQISGLAVWPMAGLWGLWKAMWSGEWKVPRRVRIDKMDCVVEELSVD